MEGALLVLAVRDSYLRHNAIFESGTVGLLAVFGSYLFSSVRALWYTDTTCFIHVHHVCNHSLLLRNYYGPNSYGPPLTYLKNNFPPPQPQITAYGSAFSVIPGITPDIQSTLVSFLLINVSCQVRIQPVSTPS